MTFSKSAALELCALNEAAYVLATTGTCKLPDGFTGPIAIRMPVDNRPFFLRGDPLDIWGFVTTKDGVLYMVFRGTELTSGVQFAQEWALDALSFPLVKFCQGNVHLGFHGAWMALRQATMTAMQEAALRTGTGRIVTGHSLGAAIATLCWADLGGDLMTFASPRVGDSAFAASLWNGQTVRVYNAPDIVPDILPDPPFRQGGRPQMLCGPGTWFDRKLGHALTSYAAGLEKL